MIEDEVVNYYHYDFLAAFYTVDNCLIMSETRYFSHGLTDVARI